MDLLINLVVKELSSVSTSIKLDLGKSKFLQAIPKSTLKDALSFLQSEGGSDVLKLCYTSLLPIIESKSIGLVDIPNILKAARSIYSTVDSGSFKRSIPVTVIIDYIALIVKIILLLLPQLQIDIETLFPLLDETGELVKINIQEHFTTTCSFEWMVCGSCYK